MSEIDTSLDAAATSRESKGWAAVASTMRRAFFYGWVVVAVTAIVILITAGVRWAPGRTENDHSPRSPRRT